MLCISCGWVARRNPPARATNVGALGGLRHDAFAPSVCARYQHHRAWTRCARSEILAALPLEICSRGVAVASEDRVSARSLCRACSENGARSYFTARERLVAQD